MVCGSTDVSSKISKSANRKWQTVLTVKDDLLDKNIRSIIKTKKEHAEAWCNRYLERLFYIDYRASFTFVKRLLAILLG